MTAMPLNWMLAEFGVSATSSGRQGDASSGAGIHAVRTADGDLAYLKITPAGLGPHALEAARREVRFYREVAATTAVQTPRLLASVESEDGVAILLTAAGQAREATSWSRRTWAAVGEQLAVLHAMPLPAGADWQRPDSLLAVMAEPDSSEVSACWAGSVPELPAVLSRISRLLADMSALPPVFTHGDCHAGNILFGGHRPALCDWQSAGIGRPVSDLAFLSARATASGAVVPTDLIAAYLARRPQDRRELERALLAEELAIFIFQWPPYLAFNTPATAARVRRRAQALAARWLHAQARPS